MAQRQPRRAPGRQGQSHQEQPHRPRLGQDGHQQRRHPGYTGVAAVDAKHQIIVEAQAHGTGSEQALLMPMVKAAAPLCTPDTLITADAGYHSDANLKALAEQRPAGTDRGQPDAQAR
jgi:hypothetical protein